MLEKKVESGNSQVRWQKENYVISVDGEEKTFESHFDFATKRVQSDAIASKELKKAEVCQLVIDEMEALRELYPTVAEIEKDLWEKS